ncbi:hypothetical protein BDK92_0919 [Micromonospora pisi]|uniref:Uncharacterized protein n=2 Tax=Micromonospora pisi TaxID=589240 RepID=A0A495JF22_9ACTN|nr:hypothetical protein BDK92_0919 [Micromonospora pisi]
MLLTLLLVLGGVVAVAATVIRNPVRIRSVQVPALTSRAERVISGVIAAACLAAAWVIGAGVVTAPSASPASTGLLVYAPQVPNSSPIVPATAPVSGPSAGPSATTPLAGTRAENPGSVTTPSAAPPARSPATTTPTKQPGTTPIKRPGTTPIKRPGTTPIKQPAKPTPSRPTGAALPTLQVGTLPGSNDYTGHCDSETTVMFNGTLYLGPSTLIRSARVHWTFTVTAGGSGTDFGTENAMVLPTTMAATALLYQVVKLPRTAPGKYSITGRYTASSSDTLPASPSSDSATIHVTCT